MVETMPYMVIDVVETDASSNWIALCGLIGVRVSSLDARFKNLRKSFSVEVDPDLSPTASASGELASSLNTMAAQSTPE